MTNFSTRPKDVFGNRAKPHVAILLRVFAWLTQWCDRLSRLVAMLRDETLWAWTTERDRESITVSLYDRCEPYLPGGQYFAQGLFDWEKRAFSTDPFPAQGRILLGAAGGGRELQHLCHKGYEVVAFEPAVRLYEGAKSTIQSCQRCKVVMASYADLIEAAVGQKGPLCRTIVDVVFHGVILGWGSLSHVLSHATRLELLRAIKIVAPHAPVFVSFLPAPTYREGKIDKLRPCLRRLFGWMKAPWLGSRGDIFSFEGGFAHFFTEEEFKSLVLTAGYEIVRGSFMPYPHAILRPQNGSRTGNS